MDTNIQQEAEEVIFPDPPAAFDLDPEIPAANWNPNNDGGAADATFPDPLPQVQDINDTNWRGRLTSGRLTLMQFFVTSRNYFKRSHFCSRTKR
jgi:hypothetical protein